MASGILVDIQEEVTCPICLELLSEPLSLNCGHSFCQACITANKNELLTDLEGKSSCPVCRTSYQPGDLRPNRHLANIAGRLREVKWSLKEEQKTAPLCARHGEKLLLFCKEDWKVICWLCERSQEHHGHKTFLLEEVVKECQEKFQKTLQRLGKKQQEIESLEIDIRRQGTQWKSQIEKEMQSVQAEYKQLRDVLDSEEQMELQMLKTQEGDILSKMTEAEHELAQQRQLVTALISNLDHQLLGSAVEMLQDVNAILHRSETLILKKLTRFSMPERSVHQAPGLRRTIQALNELKDVQQYWVDITLEPDTQKCSAVVSSDGRQVRYMYNGSFFMNHLIGKRMQRNRAPMRPAHNSNTPEQGGYCEDYGVLGSRIITSGKHYWEVDVSHKRAWILGIYDAGCCQQNQTGPVLQDQGFPLLKKHVYSLYQPKYGYQVIGLQNTSEYVAFVDSSTGDAETVTLSTTVPPRRVGIFLDGEADTLSFYNVTNQGCLIYKFSSCSFSQEVRPYLNPMTCEFPMTVC